MRTLSTALFSLFALAGLLGTSGLVIPAASDAQARLQGHATESVLDGDGKDGGQDGEDDDKDDDDEELRARG